MDSLYALFALGLGLIIGSFLNALSFRYHTGLGMGGRSRCMRCGVTLRPLDLIPILSYVFLRGRCRYCMTGIALQYPVVEAVAGLMGYGTFALHPEPQAFVLFTFIWATLLFIVIYDLRHTVLPTGGLVFLCALGLLSLFLPCGPCGQIGTSAPLSWWAFAAGPALAAPLLFLSLISRGRWMGWGDGILALPLGWLLGISQGFSALLIAFWGGSIAGLMLVAYSKWGVRNARYNMESAIPFAPFLALGALLAHAFHIDIFSLPLF